MPKAKPSSARSCLGCRERLLKGQGFPFQEYVTGLWGLHMERMERTGRRTGRTGSQEVDGPKKASLGRLILPGAVR